MLYIEKGRVVVCFSSSHSEVETRASELSLSRYTQRKGEIMVYTDKKGMRGLGFGDRE